MTAEKELPTLDQESAAKLTDFARACKAAARAVTLYPAAHPAIRVSMARLVDTAGRLTATGPVTFGVLPDNLLLDGSGAPKPDQAVRETGAMLHDHMIGIITMHSSPNPESWLPFLKLLSRPIDEVRAAGGVSRLWAATGHRHLDIQEIDYADILRDRGAGQESQWHDIIRSCLNLDSPLDDEALHELMQVCGDVERFSEFIMTLEQTSEVGTGSKAAALIRMLRGVVDLVAKTDPAKLEPMLRTMAQGFGKLSPELLLELLSAEKGRADAAADLVLRVAARMTDASLGGFVAQNVIKEGGATTRLAQAFQALVPDKERRPSLIELAKSEVAESPLAMDAWRRASAAGFGVSEATGQRYHDAYVGQPLGSENVELRRHYVGYLKDVPVSSSTLLLAGGIACMWDVSTLPEHRRKGYGACLTRVGLDDARRKGYRYASLNASSLGYSLYRSLGFNVECAIPEYRWPPRRT